MVNFRHEKISDHITRIHGITGELCYFIEGEKSGVLLDTLTGIGSLKTLVDKLTDKPYIVLLSHGHVDHAMGAPEFQDAGIKVYMSSIDEDVFKEHSDMGMRKGSASMMEPEVAAAVEEKDYIHLRKEPFLDLKEGDTFDLGGLTIETFALPGHTPGSLAFLLREDRVLFTGDACNKFTFMFFKYCLPIAEYKEKLKDFLKKVEGRFDSVLLSHGPGDAGTDIISSVIEVCDDILSGNTDDIPFAFQGEKALIAKKMDMTMRRPDGKSGNIVYNKSNILAK